MELDALFLSRVQFALTIMFHYLFPPITIGLGMIMVMMEGLFLRTGDRHYESMARFWTRIFALNFAIGVASGIVMEFQFGTNWATYSRFVGDVFGSALAAEGIFAFFLESGFLAVLVFGWDRVSPRMHFFSTVMVSLGSVFSAIWIVVANSWQQTPAGHHLVAQEIGGQTFMRAEIVDFWAVVFNPSTVHRLTHALLGAVVMGGFFVMSVAAYYLLKRRYEDFARKSFTIGLGFAAVATVALLFSGHLQARNVALTQPPKLAAFEGHLETGEGGAALQLFGWPDVEQRRVRCGIAVPGLLSWLVHGDWNRPVEGLDRTPPEDWPPLVITFWSYHLMLYMWGFCILLVLVGLVLRWRGTLFGHRALLWVFVFGVAAPLVANQLGWVAAEVGRQPWIVWGLLRTRDALSKSVKSEEILASNIMFGVIYLLLAAVWLFILDSKIKQGPTDLEPTDTRGSGLTAVAAALGGRNKTNQ